MRATESESEAAVPVEGAACEAIQGRLVWGEGHIRLPSEEFCLRLTGEIPDDPWLLPGFLDAHRHMPHGFSVAEEGDLTDLRAAAANAALLEGVSSVWDMGVGKLQPWPSRPSWVKTALRGIEGVLEEPAASFAAQFETTEACVEQIRELKRLGADHVKLFVTGTGKYTREVATRPKMTEEQISVSVAAALDAGLPVVAHCHGGPTVDTCLGSGVTAFEHALYFTRQDLEGCLENGARVTLTPGVYLSRHGSGIRDRLRRLIADIVESGVHFLIGTDHPDQTMLDQLSILIGLGMPPELALAAGTVPSKESSVFHILPGNPLEDPGMLERTAGIAANRELCPC